MNSRATDDILKFWFGTTDISTDIKKRDFWFNSTPEVDLDITERYLSLYEETKSIFGQTIDDKWNVVPANMKDCLACIIVLDQFPRHIFRGRPLAYQTDEAARFLSYFAQTYYAERSISMWPTIFLYLPREHSEDLRDHNKIPDQGHLRGKYRKQHREVLEKFGRYQHRNDILGRESTPEELEYLRTGEHTWAKRILAHDFLRQDEE